jgi:hypothetical protein
MDLILLQHTESQFCPYHHHHHVLTTTAICYFALQVRILCSELIALYISHYLGIWQS